MNFLDRTILPRIDLAREADFALGALRVRPSRREIEAGGVRLELQRRVMQVLVALAHPSAEVVSQDELISRCWGGLAVGEDAVGRCIGQLRRIAGQWPEPPFEITTIAGVGYRLVPAAGPAADIAGSAEVAKRPPKMPVAAATAAVVVVLATLGLWLGRGLVPAAKAAPSRIAILPFEPVSSSPAERAFATGLADKLQGVLSIGPAPLLPREDAATLRGAGQATFDQLGVRLLLDGTVATNGDTLQARLHLDDPGKHVTLWSVELSGPASSPDALEAQVGARAIAVLNCAGQALRPVGGLSDPEALGLYLHACDLFERAVYGDDTPGVYSTLDAFRQAANHAPGFAPAHSALARFLARYRLGDALKAETGAAAEADREARRALAIDPKDADAYVALSLLRPITDYAGREKLLDQALAAKPTWAYANLEKANLLFDTGRFGEGVATLQRAAAANPLSLTITTPFYLVENGQTAAGNSELERLQRLWPHSEQVWWNRLRVYAAEKRWDDIFALLDDRQSRPKSWTDADFHVFRTTFEARKSRTPAALAEARQEFLEPARASAELARRFTTLADLGFMDDAFRLADQWTRTRMSPFNSPQWLFVPGGALHSDLMPSEALRRDPRFIALAAKLGLVDYWRASGKWPDFCADPGLPYDCKTEAARLAPR
jgi:DNA-binding winged helix-turn-helix (wHTH) protein/tetratricopeptide (TPR) repeat protein/TolB-like protein